MEHFTSKDYKQILINESKLKGLEKDDFENTLMHFASLYAEEVNKENK
jgi:hypothetical protein